MVGAEWRLKRILAVVAAQFLVIDANKPITPARTYTDAQIISVDVATAVFEFVLLGVFRRIKQFKFIAEGVRAIRGPTKT